MKILRIFPRRTNATPDDEDVRINAAPALFDAADEVHVSVAFSWDIPRAEYLAKAWLAVAPVKVGGPAFSAPGGDFIPGRYMKRGYVITSRGCHTVRLGGLTVKFYPVSRVKRTHCLPCFLMRYLGVDCTKIPCKNFERKDKKDGVFSIRELPN